MSAKEAQKQSPGGSRLQGFYFRPHPLMLANVAGTIPVAIGFISTTMDKSFRQAKRRFMEQESDADFPDRERTRALAPTRAPTTPPDLPAIVVRLVAT